MAAIDFFNRDPVVHTWTYKLDKAASDDSNFKIADLVAAEVPLRLTGRFTGSKRPKSWREPADGFGRRTEDGSRNGTAPDQ